MNNEIKERFEKIVHVAEIIIAVAAWLVKSLSVFPCLTEDCGDDKETIEPENEH